MTAHRQAITVANRLASVPPEVVTGATLTSDRIDLIGLTAHGRHGVFASEKVTPQLFRVDLRAWLEPVTERRDQLAATVDYGQLAAVVTDQIEHQSFDLIETLADQIAQATLAADGLRAVEVTVHKPQAPIEQPFDDVAVTAHRTRPPTPSPRTTARSTSHSAEPVTVPSPRTAARSRRAVFSLGSNVGDRSGWLQFGVTGLVTTPGVSFQAISSLWETTPIGVTGQPDYLNLILIAETTLPAEELLERGLTLESLAGRVRPSTSSHQPQHGPRPLDIDLIAVGAETVTSDRLQLPHPRAHKRAFVLAPWLEADPAARLNGQPLTDWLAASSDQVVRRLPDSHLTVPASAGLS
ncbi:MAG: 2-amino-4-hydroxy-6-hydroxymethyldihydropteridine diphosphokinase [Propionibacteriaceae bacterium]|nr:2-amino-4-hydroxy-6-hydroxymethyldihydropteridine diphosphokinase [Propionibacteriaceae bacterium]